MNGLDTVSVKLAKRDIGQYVENGEWYTRDNQCGVREMRRQREISQIKIDEYYRSM